MTHLCRTIIVSRPAPTHEEIAALAYSYWEARGCMHGYALEDWLRAERELGRGVTVSSDRSRVFGRYGEAGRRQ